MEDYHGLCFTCGAYLGRGDGRQCGACLEERFAARDFTGSPATESTESTESPRKGEEEVGDA